MSNTLYDCEQCGQPFPYVCEECKTYLKEMDNYNSEHAETVKKKFIGSGEDVDLCLLA